MSSDIPLNLSCVCVPISLTVSCCLTSIFLTGSAVRRNSIPFFRQRFYFARKILSSIELRINKYFRNSCFVCMIINNVWVMYMYIMHVYVFKLEASIRLQYFKFGVDNHNEGYIKFKAGRKIRNLSY